MQIYLFFMYFTPLGGLPPAGSLSCMNVYSVCVRVCVHTAIMDSLLLLTILGAYVAIGTHSSTK